MNLKEYADQEMMMIDVAGQLAVELVQALHNKDRVTLAVPGGTTPGPIFDDLCGTDHVPWERINVLLTDERWVPKSSDRSNTRLLRERLLINHAAEATLIPMHAETESPEEALANLSMAIAPALPLDVLLLGMGADMHIASLFPGADRLGDAMAPDARILMPMRAPGAPEPRVTLTAPVLEGAMSTHIVITGPEKREALERARKIGNPAEAPVLTVLNSATVHWTE